jgi:CHASE2 domain-containing sensor protein
MQNDQASIFDQQFLTETRIRRRQLMPLAMKIYVWFYLVVSAFFLVGAALFYPTVIKDGGFSPDNPMAILIALLAASLILVIFLSSLFILLEWKRSILFALIAMGLTICLFSSSFVVSIYRSEQKFDAGFAKQAGWILLMVPYLVMLLKIKRDWETKAVAGK